MAKIRDGRVAALIAAVLLALLGGFAIAGWTCRLQAEHTWDLGPAQLAMHTRDFLEGRPLYPDFLAPPYDPPNLYGPVVPMLAAPLVRWFGNSAIAPLSAGRLLTLISTIVVCGLILWFARHEQSGTICALIAALAFLLSPFLQPWGFEFRVDMPALAIELGGLAIFAAGAQWIALAVFVLAFFAKQTRIIGIAAAVVALWLAGRRGKAIAMALGWLVLVIVASAALRHIYPLYDLNTYRALAPIYVPVTALRMFGLFVAVNAPVFALAAAYIARTRRWSSLAVLYFLLSLLHDVSLVRWGSAFSYLFPTLASAAILAAPELDWLLERMPGGKAWLLQPVVGLVIMVAAAPLYVIQISEGRAGTFGCGAASAQARLQWNPAAMDRLRGIAGPIVTDLPGLALEHPSAQVHYLDLLPLFGMLSNGSFDDRSLIESLDQRRVAAIALDDKLLDTSYQGRKLFWPALRAAIERNYELASPLGPPFIELPRSGMESGARHPSIDGSSPRK